MGEKIISDCSIWVILDNLSETDLPLPLDENDMEVLLEHIELLESSLSDRKDSGESIDEKLLIDVSNCVDEIAIYEDDEYIDMNKLNERLNQFV